MHYRKDIDGLRAIAVLFVMLFHFKVPGFSGGYTGVDIFFVLSGFLITSLISKSVMENSFSFSRFYYRRAKRLLPTFILVCILTLLFSLFLLPSYHHSRLYEEFFHSILNISNFFFYSQEGYFFNGQALRPFLHTWSLAVEEQFYIIWPIIVVSLLKIKTITPKKFVNSILLILSISFFMNLIFHDDKDAIFYLTPFRMFEFCFGAILVNLKENKRLSGAGTCFIGLMLIFIPVFLFTDEVVFPSYNALLTCLGSVVLIMGSGKSKLSKIYNNEFMSQIGKISYPLYLIHWPVFVICNYYFDKTFGSLHVLVLFVLSFSLALLVNKYIERPFRYSDYFEKKINPSQFGFSISLVVIVLVGLSTYGMTGKMKFRKSKELVGQEVIEKTRNEFKGLRSTACELGWHENVKNNSDLNGFICNPKAKIQILTIGNSHEFNSYYVLREILKTNEKVNIVYGSTGFIGREDCDGTFNSNEVEKFQTKNTVCKKKYKLLSNFEYIAKSFSIIVVGAFRILEWNKELLDYVQALQKYNPKIKVLVYGSLVDIGPYSCADLINRENDLGACNNPEVVRYFNPNEEKEIRKKYPDLDFYFYDKIKVFCRHNQIGGCTLTNKGIPFFFDGHHLNSHGMKNEVKLLQKNRRLLRNLYDFIE